ncbi:MAG: tryptophanyl-tRNA synthetase [Promethearchaeota archaeon CR_4]|nr:MAG: tryptophanyl-tRNA synthetase [Candidatus Lokiarchaeota archaeon CR_4]
MVDPWGTQNINNEDEERLIKEFGLQPIDDVMWMSVKEHNSYFRRRITFAHRDFDLIIKAMERNAPWAVMSGIKPSGSFHLGTFTTASEIVELQNMGGRSYYCIADIESWEDNGISYADAYNTAIDNLADILALGLNPNRAYVWRQSKERIVKNVPFKVARKITNAWMRDMYGDKEFGLYLAALIQVGDILLPQIKDEPMPTVVPVGLDQAPHLRLTRDLTEIYYKKFFKPSSTYHRLLPGLDGSEKMSKRNPNSYFSFDEELESIKYKVSKAFTGGRGSAEEQRRLGGETEKCMIYRILMYGFEKDDKVLTDLYQDCRGGKILCGPCKKRAIETIITYIKNHRERKQDTLPIAREILSRKHKR